MRAQPLICVSDVEASSRWYRKLLNLKSDHGGSAYERLVANGQLILQLHSFQVEHDHGRIGDPADRPYGNGLLLWFEIDDFEEALHRASELHAEIVLPRRRNPPAGDGGPNHWELGTVNARESVVLRPIQSVDGMTADVIVMNPYLLDDLTRRLLSLPEIAAVFYDLTHKPPGTIEWE